MAEYLLPATVTEALALKQARGAGAVFAFGMTALQLIWGEDGPAQAVIDLSGLHLDGEIRLLPDGRLALPAGLRLQTMLRSPLLARQCPMLPALLPKLAAAGVRNLASLGGNLLWGRGDLEIPFLALGCELVFAGGAVVALDRRDLFPADDILLQAVIHPAQGGHGFVEKLGAREAFSPARVVVAGSLAGGACRFALRLGAEPARLSARVEELFRPDDDAYLARAAHNLLRGHAEALGFPEAGA